MAAIDFPNSPAVNDQFTAAGKTWVWTGTSWDALGGGSVTSIGLSMPSIFNVSGSPVTSSGTISVSLANAPLFQFFAGGTGAFPTTPTFRSITAADLPSHYHIIADVSGLQTSLDSKPTGSSTSGYVTYWTGTGTVSGESNLFWDATNHRLGIANTTPSYKLDVTGSSRIQSGALGVNVTPNATAGRIDASNDIVAYSSDKRLKENIKPITNALDKLKQLTGFTYNWNQLAGQIAGFTSEQSQVGLFAQDVETVLPEAVKPAPFDNDGNDGSLSGQKYLTVQYEKLTPLLIEGIKEQQKLIEQLFQEIETLKQK